MTDHRGPLASLGALRRVLAAVTSRRNAARYVLGRAVGLVLLVLGAMVGVISVKEAALAAGITGTSGTYTVEECHERYPSAGSGRHAGRTISCTGAFHPDQDGGNGGSGDGASSTSSTSSTGSNSSTRSASSSSKTGSTGSTSSTESTGSTGSINPFGTFHPDTVYPPGTRVPVQAGDGGTYVVAGWKRAWGNLAGVAVALPMLAAGVFCLLTGFGARWGRSFADTGTGCQAGSCCARCCCPSPGWASLVQPSFSFCSITGDAAGRLADRVGAYGP
ncbi:hypothetical protein [Streptomyces albofaciens]|uniref:hypothetical protein n=1 Tax=Streptomyces albofaciens TaxID=66866 RepID=UPI00142F2810|nr:hypothetical protein [Streptomyces albofaciens]